MADIIDKAQEGIEAAHKDAIARATATLKREGCENCQDCGNSISLARRRAMPSTERCLPCQSLLERRR